MCLDLFFNQHLFPLSLFVSFFFLKFLHSRIIIRMRLENPLGGEQENVAFCWLRNPLSPQEGRKSPRYNLGKNPGKKA